MYEYATETGPYPEMLLTSCTHWLHWVLGSVELSQLKGGIDYAESVLFAFVRQSTILRILRSTVKYFIEDPDVDSCWHRETNDFPKPQDMHCYEDCRSTPGCWLLCSLHLSPDWRARDEAAQISITQQAYRETFNGAREGQPEMINFVRCR